MSCSPQTSLAKETNCKKNTHTLSSLDIFRKFGRRYKKKKKCECGLFSEKSVNWLHFQTPGKTPKRRAWKVLLTCTAPCLRRKHQKQRETGTEVRNLPGSRLPATTLRILQKMSLCSHHSGALSDTVFFKGWSLSQKPSTHLPVGLGEWEKHVLQVCLIYKNTEIY